MSDHLSRHVDNDDARHFTFARTSGLPIDYFGPPRRRWITAERVLMFLVCCVLIAAILGWNPNP